MAENIVVMTLPTHSGTYEAFSKLKNAAGFDLNAAVIIERDADGIAHLAEGRDYQAGAATTGGSLIGMLVGILGGPLGMLLGLGAGALTGSLIDADRLDLGDDVISDFAKVVPPGGNAILAQVVEDAPAALNAFADSVSATVVRRPVEEVVAEIEAQQAAAEAAARAAREAVREHKKQELREKWDERIENLKAKFQRNDK